MISNTAEFWYSSNYLSILYNLFYIKLYFVSPTKLFSNLYLYIQIYMTL